MAERKYSVAEIDRMRGALVSMCSSDRDAEDRLRTYMLNGTEPEELEGAANEHSELMCQRQREEVEMMRELRSLKRA
jgi:hypothetical protein